MRTKRWIGTVGIAAIAAMTLGAGHPNWGITIIGGTPAQRAMARWAEARYSAAGLALPPLEVRFHVDRSGCHERLGYYLDGVASICGTHADRMARRTLVHEMAHGWIESNLSGAEGVRFLELRGLRSWNDPWVDWEERGFEQAAEIMAWALDDQGTGIHMPSIPDNSRGHLAEGFEFLTGDPLPVIPRED
jgi:hypothetical protein